MKITALLENTARRGDMRTEHGLSLYIETETHKILFDMGQTDAFYENAKTLGIDLAEVDFAVISHGHYDHGGGLAKFLEINAHAPVYIMRDAFLPHYNAKGKYIGLDTALVKEPRIVFTDNIYDEFSIAKDITLYSCNCREPRMEHDSCGLTELNYGMLSPDTFFHEQYLQIENIGEDAKCVVISGCSHKGILNIADWFCPDVIVGGFHFSKKPLDEKLAAMAAALDEYGTVYYTCHCTGAEQFEFMRERMKKLHYLACGESIEL
ncbi:MAG: MBL fold metallo-hydrolase [Clostridia bacterium]|nr:MBL fold metallo-hydrolase [Clostridia bacterium]